MKLLKLIKAASLIEVLIAVGVLIFVSFVFFYVLSGSLTKSTLLTKKSRLSNELNQRVSEYMLSNSFEDSSIGSFSFSQQDITSEGNSGLGVGNSTTEGNQGGGTTGSATSIDYNLKQFSATDSETNVSVRQKALVIN
ncbi:hypothetical protein [Candidatus Francisella endociliophora]|uniref:hypothetical protein n=1 Tax=Candidatus Francisella endociliophora TaxID=653937 RepID=UPI000694C58E|nr:hypothetical protein [Francisella sp. FSC1006]